MQISAPSSITAWLNTRGLHPRSAFSACAWITLRVSGLSTGSSIPKIRANTRSTFASTATEGLSKAMLLIAPAVYKPIPGIFLKASRSPGIHPPWFATTYLAPISRLRARE